MSTEKKDKLERSYWKAVRLIDGEIHLSGKRCSSSISLWSRFKLWRALRLYKQVMKGYPNSWNSLWAMGKIYERLGKYGAAFECFSRGFDMDSNNPKAASVAIEASIAATRLGLAKEAESYARKAVGLKPKDVGLRSDLALALLISGKIEEAHSVIKEVLEDAPDDGIAKGLAEVIEYVLENDIEPPSDYDGIYEIEKKMQKSR